MFDSLALLLEGLRARGLRVSPAEVSDAARALAAVNLESRATAHAALRVALAKSRPSRATFDAVFEELFVAPGRRRQDRRGAGETERGGAGAGAGRRTVPRAPASSLARELKSKALRDAGKPKLARESSRLRRVVLAPDRRRVGLARAADATLELAVRLTTADERRLAAAAADALARLRLRRGRRLRPGRRGRLSVKRTIRQSLRSGGVPFALARDRRRRRRPRIVLLLDVSRSVALAASLLVFLCGRILSAIGRTRVFAFVDHPVEVTSLLAAWLASPACRDPLSFRAVLAGDRRLDLDAASDYGRTLFALVAEPALRVRDLVLIVLGDGRNNRFEPMAWALGEVVDRARWSAWVVAEPAARWGTADSSLGLYLPRVDVAVEAGDLGGLVEAVQLCVREIV